MTIHFGQGKLEAHERQAILEAVYQQAKDAATTAVKAVIEALLEAEVTAWRNFRRNCRLVRSKSEVVRIHSHATDSNE